MSQLIIRCHVQFPSSFSILGHFIMKEILKKNIPHLLYLLSDDSGPFDRSEYEYLLDNRISTETYNRLCPKSNVLSITTVPSPIRPKREILYTASEGTKLTSHFRDQIIGCDKIIVPSEFSLNAMYRSSIPIDKLEVVPHGLEPSLFPLVNPPDKFTFLSVGAWDWRKALPELITAFKKEFDREEVYLKIRTNGVAPRHDKQYTIEPSNIPFSRMGDIYKGASAFVLPTRGEGFCLTAMEALASGLPIIMTKSGGHAEYLQQDYNIVSSIKKVKRDEVDDVYYYEPDMDSMVKQMRYVIDNYDEARKKSISGSHRVKLDYTWENTWNQLYSIIKGEMHDE